MQRADDFAARLLGVQRPRFFQRLFRSELDNGVEDGVDRLNLREATEQKADVVVRGTIARYEVDLPAGASADPRQTASTRRRLQLVIDIEIVEQSSGRSLFKKQGMTMEGQYPEGGEANGRRDAIDSFVSQLVEGMQSQW